VAVIREKQRFTTTNPQLAEVVVTGVFREYLNHDSEGPYTLIEFEDIHGETYVMDDSLFQHVYTLAKEPEVRYYQHVRDGHVTRVVRYSFSAYENAPSYKRVTLADYQGEDLSA
jgi:hypothetical protein